MAGEGGFVIFFSGCFKFLYFYFIWFYLVLWIERVLTAFMSIITWNFVCYIGSGSVFIPVSVSGPLADFFYLARLNFTGSRVYGTFPLFY